MDNLIVGGGAHKRSEEHLCTNIYSTGERRRVETENIYARLFLLTHAHVHTL